MRKFCTAISALLFFCSIAAGQLAGERMLFIIDSIPVLNTPESWNTITKEDIADMTVVRGRDSLKQLGWEDIDGITYIFTKEYRRRPDSLKRFPSLKQMEIKNGAVYFHDSLYSGRYIDYYNSGKKQDEGELQDGKLNGELTVYFKNGNVKTVSTYQNGTLHGAWREYYPSGVLMHTREYAKGRVSAFGSYYFINGQVRDERKPRNKTKFDTAVSYYSTGVIRQRTLIRDGQAVRSKKDNDRAYYSTMFFQHLNSGLLKEANKSFYQLWLLDSANADTHFKEGLLLLKEFRFDDAIDAFDRALAIEPLMRETLVHRGLARLKKYKYQGVNTRSKDFRESSLFLKDLVAVSEEEQEKICADFRKAEYLDSSELFVARLVPEIILRYCLKQESTKRE